MSNSTRSAASFNLTQKPLQNGAFSPRLGRLTVTKAEGHTVQVETPGFITSTSRGIVPHLTKDHVDRSDAIRLVNMPFETLWVFSAQNCLSSYYLASSLEHSPPLPTIIGGPHALQKSVGLNNVRHIISMSLRDPCDGREMPPNGKKFVNAWCIRGVRKVTFEHIVYPYRSDIDIDRA